MNFCPNCGTKIATNAKFCTGCGQPLAEATKSTNNESAEEDIYSADNSEDTSINTETEEIEKKEAEDECEFEDEELAATEEYNPAKEENTETGTLSGLEQRKLAIDKFLRTRKDYSKMKRWNSPLSICSAIVLSLICTDIVFTIGGAIVGWILFGLCGIDPDHCSEKVYIIVGLGILYALWKVLKWFYDIFVDNLSNYFCRSFINKYADEICATLPVSKRDIGHFSHDDDCIRDLLTANASSIKPKSKSKSKSKQKNKSNPKQEEQKQEPEQKTDAL